MKKLIFLFVIILIFANSKVNAQFGETFPEFEITVPNSYNPDTQIDVTLKKAKLERTVDRVDPCLTGTNYSKETAKLIPGEKYQVKIIPITEMISSQQCMNHLKSYKATLAGLHGLTLIYSEARNKLPKDKWIISFAAKEELFADNSGNHAVPYIHTYEVGDYSFGINNYENDCWIPGKAVLLCLVKKE